MYNFLACYNRIGYITVVPSLKIYANSRQVIFCADSVAPQILPVNLCLVQLPMLDKSNRMLEPALFNQPITTHSQNARQRCSFKLYPKIFLSRYARQTPSGYNCKTTHFYSPSWQKNSPPYRHQIDYARTTFHQIPKTSSGWPNRFMPQTLLVVCASQRKCRSASCYLQTLCSPISLLAFQPLTSAIFFFPHGWMHVRTVASFSSLLAAPCTVSFLRSSPLICNRDHTYTSCLQMSLRPCSRTHVPS